MERRAERIQRRARASRHLTCVSHQRVKKVILEMLHKVSNTMFDQVCLKFLALLVNGAQWIKEGCDSDLHLLGGLVEVSPLLFPSTLYRVIKLD